MGVASGHGVHAERLERCRGEHEWVVEELVPDGEMRRREARQPDGRRGAARSRSEGTARRSSAPEVSAATFVEAHYHWLCMTKHLHTLVTHAADV